MTMFYILLFGYVTDVCVATGLQSMAVRHCSPIRNVARLSSGATAVSGSSVTGFPSSGPVLPLTGSDFTSADCGVSPQLNSVKKYS